MPDRDNSGDPTPWAIICRGDPDVGYDGCGRVFLTEALYIAQIENPWTTWRCPACGFGEAVWDDSCQETSPRDDEREQPHA